MSHVAIECHRFPQPVWDRVLRDFEDANFVQSWAYGAACWGARRLEHVLIKQCGVTMGAAQVLVLRIPGVYRGLAYIKWGPLWRRAGQPEDPVGFARLLGKLREFYAVQRGLLLRVTPWELAEAPLRSAFECEGFRTNPAGPVRCTAIVDLCRTREELRASLTRHWRHNLKIAEKNGLEIAEGTSPELVREFHALYTEMRSRKNGWIPAIGNFWKAYAAMSEEMKPRIAVCRSRGEPVAGLIVSSLGRRAIAVFAATGNRGLELRGSYLLQWRTLERLRAQGVWAYDLGGINAKTHPGPTQFKMGLAGKLGRQAEYVGEFHACERWSSEVLVRAGDFVHAKYKGALKEWRRRMQMWNSGANGVPREHVAEGGAASTAELGSHA